MTTDFWSRMNKAGPTTCWEWSGKRNREGYGQLEIAGKYVRAHRIAWEKANGPISPGMLVCHRCDNPPCCNPAHLFLGTNAENMGDMASKGRAVSNPPRGVNQHSHKLTEDDVRAIRSSVGISQKALGLKYGVSQPTINSIVRRKYWAHVD